MPGAQPISADDRVYTVDQTSNTVSVIDPANNQVLGTLPLGSQRLNSVLGPQYSGEIGVHGIGFSRDGRLIDVVDVTSNAVHTVDAATNKTLSTTYVGRAPHEAFISPDGLDLSSADRRS